MERPLKSGNMRVSVLHMILHELFCCCWQQGNLSQDLCDVIIIVLYKNKGEQSDCFNYREITLLSIEVKILARFLLNSPSLKSTFQKVRAFSEPIGARHGVFSPAASGEVSGTKQGAVCDVIDLTKAFDTVSRRGMWQTRLSSKVP